jgi:RNA polymerase sigma factor (sigma-70 family)
MPNRHNENRTYTRKLSREINAAYEAYKAGAPDGGDRLLRAFVARARNIARFRLGEMYDGTVAYDAAHSAMLALNDFHGKSALSTWFYRIALNESFSELGRLIKKREREESINVPVRGGEPGETKLLEKPEYPPDPAPAMDLAELRSRLPSKQAEVFDLHEQGYTVSQIAEMRGLPRGTVAGRLRLAKEKLRGSTEKQI